MKLKQVGQGKKKNAVGLIGMLTAVLMAGSYFSFGAEPGQWTTTASAASVSDNAITQFKDIKGHWAQAAMAKAYEKKLISGYQDGTFRPNGRITRGEYAAILARATRIESVEGQEAAPFPDLQGHWSEPAVRQLVGQGFIHAGDYAGGFKPNTELTRYEMMKWIANGLIQSDRSFQDAFNDTKNTLLPTPEVNRGMIRDEQIPYLALVRGTGIVSGFQDGTLKPADTTTRAEIASIILRYMEVEGKDASKYSELNELREVGTTGTNLTTISNYKYSSGSATISDLSSADISLSNKSGILQIHRLIVVDATRSKPKGIYARFFVPDKYASGSYRTFADISFTSNLEKSNLITFNKGLSDSLIQFNRINLDLAKEQHNETIPMDSDLLIKKGIKKRFWITSTLRNTSWSYFLKSDHKGEFKIQR
ncbi:S-layer homology domain-containing protein [Paenibacillus sp. FSL R7-0652]|uniref:S-layer homology domain-containing protein n=1 Tax=Paenibacillus sp. AN1007 TaxID=3151385 RepID=A0AAU8NH46_9BACL